MSTPQIALPVEIDLDAVVRKKSLGGAIELCAELAGFELDKQLSSRMHVDKSQFSRWHSGEEGIKWPKLQLLMDTCGNDAPAMWMMHDRGWDIKSFRKLESETERENRLLREENQALRRLMLGGVQV